MCEWERSLSQLTDGPALLEEAPGEPRESRNTKDDSEDDEYTERLPTIQDWEKDDGRYEEETYR